jgi:hypothetical protein
MMKRPAPRQRSHRPGTSQCGTDDVEGAEMTSEATIAIDDFRSAFLILLQEVFVGGGEQDFVLDSGTSLIETLRGISAAEASVAVSGRTASIAAQVNHTAVYLEAIAAGPGTKVDWDASWTDVTEVDDAAWEGLIVRVETAMASIKHFASEFAGWDGVYLGGAMALIVHTAYHLGEIRTSIGVLRERNA